MKKAISIIMAIAMVVVMAVPAFASGMQLSTSVPYEHSVTINYNDGGYVLVNGKLCPDNTQFNINRFGEIDLGIVFRNGYHLGSISVNGMDITDQFVSGNLKIADIVNDVCVNIVFEKCSDDPNDKCGKVDMEGTVYLGKKEVKGAELSFDFGSATAKTDSDGRYYVKDISDGKHVVEISKDGEVLAHTTFVIERADVTEPTLTTASDGTQVILIPQDADKIYLDFNIADNDGNDVPDKDPDETDPGNPDNPSFEDPDGDPDIPSQDVTPDDGEDDEIATDGDEDNDGVIITIGSPKKDVPTLPIPDTFVKFFENPIVIGSLMVLSLFFIILIIFKRKKDEEDERELVVK